MPELVSRFECEDQPAAFARLYLPGRLYVFKTSRIKQRSLSVYGGPLPIRSICATAATVALDQANRASEVAQYFMQPNMTIVKHTPIATEPSRAQLRGEFFNIFNQVNFNNPNTGAPSRCLRTHH
jgi:hypothetical protein